MGKIVSKLVFLLIVASFYFSVRGIGQENNSKFKTALSFSAGLLTENTQSTQLHGLFGYKLKQRKIELRADGFYFLGSYGDRPRFSMNHQFYAGAFYTFLTKNLQPYAGIQPGIAYSQASEVGWFNSETSTIEFQKTINPTLSATGGLALYADKLFFMFIETRYIMGKHTSNSVPVFLDELRFSFGLGFHL